MAVLTLSPHADGGRNAILKRLRQTQRDRHYRVLTFNSIEFDEDIVNAVVDLLYCARRKWERINFINCSGPVDTILANALALDTVHALELVDADKEVSKPLVKAPGRGLLNNTSISKLRLRVGFFDTPACLTRAIAMNRNLHELDVSGSWLRGDSVPGLADTLRKNETLRVVRLKFCGLTDCEIAHLVEAVSHNTSLEGLEIGQYSCGPLTLTAVGRLLEKNSIVWLRIRHQSLLEDQTPDLSELANKLAHNTSLKSLDLSLTKLCPWGMACLGLSLKSNSSLQCLTLNHCGISAHGMRSFCVSLPHMRGLKTIKLTGNPIEDTASDGLNEGVRSNQELEYISCSNLSKEIRSFLDLNRSGRRLLFASHNSISSALWPLVEHESMRKSC
jgi:Ran GTPase-activating protein (RanGAP) involved in mRNA processing and transport